MMLVGAAIVLVVGERAARALTPALAMPPIAVLTWSSRTGSSRSRAGCRSGRADLTEASDEAVVGIEMVQAFGREDDVRARFGGRAEAVRHEAMRQASVEARFLPGPALPADARDRAPCSSSAAAR